MGVRRRVAALYAPHQQRRRRWPLARQRGAPRGQPHPADSVALGYAAMRMLYVRLLCDRVLYM